MLALGCDHGGYELKQEIFKYLEKNGLEYKDYGTYSEASCDYPDFAKAVAESILNGAELDYVVKYIGDVEKMKYNLLYKATVLM